MQWRRTTTGRARQRRAFGAGSRLFSARGREKSLLKFMEAASFCPLCPYSKKGSIDHGLDCTTRTTWERHLAVRHPTELSTLRLGYKLHRSAFASPLVPRYVDAPWMRLDPSLKKQYIKPLTAARFKAASRSKKILFGKYLRPSLYVDPSIQGLREYIDRVAGKLLTSGYLNSEIRRERTTGSRELSCARIRSASLVTGRCARSSSRRAS